MQIDQDKLDQLEAELTNRIEANVRGRLFKHYIAIGVFIAATLGYFGYDIVSSLRDIAKTKAEEAVKGAETSARRAAREAEIAVIRSQAQLEALNRQLTRRETIILNSELETEKSRLLVRTMGTEVQRNLEDIKESLNLMQVEISKTAGELEAQFQALRDRSSDLAGRGNLSNLAEGLETLTLQVRALGEQIDAVQQRIASGSTEPGASWPNAVPGLDENAVKAVLDTARLEKFQKTAAVLPNRTTVYFQFAGVTRNVAQQISQALKKIGYDMPVEDRVGAAAGKKQIRYFHEMDRDAADRLARDLTKVLDRMRFESEIEVVDMTGYQSVKPRLGTIELWLEPILK